MDILWRHLSGFKDAPNDWSLTAYAVGAGQDLYVTVINKMQGHEPDRAAQGDAYSDGRAVCEGERCDHDAVVRSSGRCNPSSPRSLAAR